MQATIKIKTINQEISQEYNTSIYGIAEDIKKKLKELEKLQMWQNKNK